MEQDIVDSEDAELWGGDVALVEIGFDNERIAGNVPLERITRLFDPFVHPPWHDGQGVTMAGVRAALNKGRLETKPYSAEFFARDWTSIRHEQRIAWLVLNPSTEPIQIEFSEPGYEACSIDDGNHRLAAAIIRSDAEIAIQIGGFFAHSVRALGVICRPLQRIGPVASAPAFSMV